MLISALSAFLEPVNPNDLAEDEGFLNGQIGSYLADDNQVDTANLVLLGCNEWRGAGPVAHKNDANSIRQKFYQLYHWHTEVALADAGNVKVGATLADSYAALKTVVKELLQAGKKVLVFGGSHDNTIALYAAFAHDGRVIEASVIDALIDLDADNPIASRNFLFHLLTSEPNFVRHFSLIGFQSYFAYPRLLETIDKLRFDCYRVGRVQEKMDDIEPAIRSSQLLSVDINALAHAYAPVNTLSPNGLTGQDMCKLMQYAGMSATNGVTGLFGFAGNDSQGLTAMQLAQMMWYYLDGVQKLAHEVPVENRDGYNEYHTLCAEVDTLFLQSRNTNRWWMQMPDGSFMACSYADYQAASNNELPERWLRAQERM
ncbi:MAG: arginase [Bacteroidetes bacterium]|nr:MAG: arginase [Bacteroidota bacterium]